MVVYAIKLLFSVAAVLTVVGKDLRGEGAPKVGTSLSRKSSRSSLQAAAAGQCFFKLAAGLELAVQDNAQIATVSVPSRDYQIEFEVFPTSLVASTFPTSIINLKSTSDFQSSVPSVQFINNTLRVMASYSQSDPSTISASVSSLEPLPLLSWSSIKVVSCGQRLTLSITSLDPNPALNLSLRAGLGVVTSTFSALLPFARAVVTAVEVQVGEASVPASAGFVRKIAICPIDDVSAAICSGNAAQPLAARGQRLQRIKTGNK
jgi:hypothetical protein